MEAVTVYFEQLIKTGLSIPFLLIALSPVVLAFVVSLIQKLQAKSISFREHQEALEYAFSGLRPQSRRLKIVRRYLTLLFLTDTGLFVASFLKLTDPSWLPVIIRGAIWLMVFVFSGFITRLHRAHQDQLMAEKKQWAQSTLSQCVKWCSDYLLIKFYVHQDTLMNDIQQVFVFPEVKSDSVDYPSIGDFFFDPLYLNIVVVTKGDSIFSLSPDHLLAIHTKNTLRNLLRRKYQQEGHAATEAMMPAVPPDLMEVICQKISHVCYESVTLPTQKDHQPVQVYRDTLDAAGLNEHYSYLMGGFSQPLQTDESFLQEVVKLVYGGSFLELHWAVAGVNRVIWIPKYSGAGDSSAVNAIQSRIRKFKWFYDSALHGPLPAVKDLVEETRQSEAVDSSQAD